MTLRRAIPAVIAVTLVASVAPMTSASASGPQKAPPSIALKGTSVFALVRSGKVVIAGTDSGTSRSADGGNHWKSVGISASTQALAVDPTNPQTIYAGVGTDLWRSGDAGKTWNQLAALSPTAVPTANNPLPTVTAIAARGALVVVGTTSDAYISNDGGATFKHAGIQSNFGYDSINSVATSAAGIVYVAGRNVGVGYGSVDPTSGSVRWSYADETLPAIGFVGNEPSAWNATSIFLPSTPDHQVFVEMCGAEVFSNPTADLGQVGWSDRGSVRYSSKTVDCGPFQAEPLTRSDKVYGIGNRQHVGFCSDNDACVSLGVVNSKLTVLSVALGDPKKAKGPKRELIGTSNGLTAVNLPSDLG